LQTWWPLLTADQAVELAAEISQLKAAAADATPRKRPDG
jgi:hypothetical protein